MDAATEEALKPQVRWSWRACPRPFPLRFHASVWRLTTVTAVCHIFLKHKLSAHERKRLLPPFPMPSASSCRLGLETPSCGNKYL